MSESYYFSHDLNARNDRKLIKVHLKYRMAGIGIYWSLVEMLHEENGFLPLSEVPFIAATFKEKESIILSIITDFELFKNDGKLFWSDSAKRRIDERLSKSEKARESANKRWENANAMRTHSEGNAIKETKERNKGNKYVDSDFEKFWNLYDKKIGEKGKLKLKWDHLTKEEHDKIFRYIPLYIKSQPDKNFRKNPETFLNNKSWNDEIISLNTGLQNGTVTHDNGLPAHLKKLN